MSTDMITTPPIIANGKYQMPPIAEDDRYLAKWHKQELEADFDWLQWNQNVSDEHPEDLVWPTRRIVGLRTRVVDDEVREILTFNWQPCWIPVHLFNEHNSEQLTKDLDDKRCHERLPANEWKVAKRNSTLELPYKPLVRRVLKVTTVKREDGTTIDMAKVVFANTFEHCTALGPQLENYRQLYQRRMEQAKRILGKKDLTKANRATYVRYFALSELALADIEKRIEARKKISQKP